MTRERRHQGFARYRELNNLRRPQPSESGVAQIWQFRGARSRRGAVTEALMLSVRPVRRLSLSKPTLEGRGCGCGGRSGSVMALRPDPAPCARTRAASRRTFELNAARSPMAIGVPRGGPAVMSVAIVFHCVRTAPIQHDRRMRRRWAATVRRRSITARRPANGGTELGPTLARELREIAGSRWLPVWRSTVRMQPRSPCARP